MVVAVPKNKRTRIVVVILDLFDSYFDILFG